MNGKDDIEAAYRRALISAADDDYASPVARDMAYRILFRMIGQEERDKADRERLEKEMNRHEDKA